LFRQPPTLIFYDVRNRGRCDTVTDEAKLARGILQDAADLATVRSHFGITQVDLIAHSYMGLMAALYAMNYPAHANRLALIGPMQPDAATEYPAHLTGADAVLADVFSRLAEMRKERAASGQPQDPQEACEKFWSVLRAIYVVNPGDAAKIRWGRCHLPNERNFMKYWTESIFPSIRSLHFSAEQRAQVKSPVLIVHAARDRSSPYGGGRDWASMLPNAEAHSATTAAQSWLLPEKPCNKTTGSPLP
jgi:pimeloyl-ACP methyl ester carboxylesterase